MKTKNKEKKKKKEKREKEKNKKNERIQNRKRARVSKPTRLKYLGTIYINIISIQDSHGCEFYWFYPAGDKFKSWSGVEITVLVFKNEK